MKMEESPVGESSSNGAIEHAIGRSTAVFRTFKVALEMKLDTKVQNNWDIVPWMARHSSNIINWTRKDNSGRTSYHKRRGRPFNKTLAIVGESVFYLQPDSLGKRKWAPRWEIGVWQGLTDTSGEYIIGSDKGTIKVRTFKPVVDGPERWNLKRIQDCKGTPWQPVPGTNSTIIPTHVVLPDTMIPARPTYDDRAPNLRGFRINRDDVLRHGFTEGCPGCTAIQCDKTDHAKHNNDGRVRFGRILGLPTIPD